VFQIAKLVWIFETLVGAGRVGFSGGALSCIGCLNESKSKASTRPRKMFFVIFCTLTLTLILPFVFCDLYAHGHGAPVSPFWVVVVFGL
jgi:hypothetical protein